MNIEEAIAAHLEWKQNARGLPVNPDGSIEAQDVASDSKCQLGHWLYGMEGPLLSTDSTKLFFNDTRNFTRSLQILSGGQMQVSR